LFPSLLAAASLLFFAGQAHCQEALRMSLAGNVAAESRRQAASSIGYYNLLLGPVAWRFSTSLAMDYEDNINLQSQNKEGDLIIRPNLNAQMHWPVTLQNSLDASLGVGYSFYVRRSDLDQFYMTPGSGLSFDIYAGNCVINLHDRVSVTQSAYQNPTANGSKSFAQLDNSAGVSATWDMNKLVAQFGYDHATDTSIGSVRQVPDTASDNWFANAGLHLLPQLTAGVEGGLGLISYSQTQSAPTQPDALQWNAGVFAQFQISQYISGKLDAGYTVYTPSATAAFPNPGSSSGIYFQFSLTHQLNQFISYSLSAGRSTESSVFGQPYTLYFARLQPDWKVFKKYSLSTPLFWQKGNQLASQLYGTGGSSDYTQYGAGFNIGRALTRKLTASLAYQYVRENSTQSGPTYTVNIVSLNLSYQF
jgi:hypothetical protein